MIHSLSALIGQACLGIGILSAFLQAFKRTSKYPLLWPMITLGSVSFSFGILLWAHLTSNFSFLNVLQHSHTTKPFLYKVCGVWASHEGSMLLWVLLLCGYNAKAVHSLPPDLKILVGRILALLSLAFLIFISLACNPFTIVLEPPLQGEDLNPLLQDPSLLFHPPFLYLGQVGGSVPFALCIVALLKKNLSPIEAHWIRWWALFSWVFLTIGLALGSFWAYYELGWGGWWFWDPVETIALLPWLTTTALFHCMICVEKQGTLKRIGLFLGILTFSLCLFSVFFIRSGLLPSIHSFAIDEERGSLLFIILCFFFIPTLTLWAWRWPCFSTSSPRLWSRAGMIALNNGFLLFGAITLLLALLYPLILAQGWGQNITIETPYFQATFIPIMVGLLLIMGLGIWVMDDKNVLKKLLPIVSLSLASVLLCWWLLPAPSLLAFFSIGAAVWVMGSSLRYLLQPPFSLKNLSLSLAHFGLGLMVFGMVCASYGDQGQEAFLKEGEGINIGGHHLIFNHIQEKKGSNYTARQAVLSLSKGDKEIGKLKPEKRYYWTQSTTHTETALYSSLFSHIQAVLLEDDQVPCHFQFYHKPFINLLWLGAGLMVFGGFLRVWARRKQHN